ncbi:GNAT family N-acetyltransferase [Taklimakanibacter lacteus]|uniref:GNAT family N-acetyltransferase n=1 Tax=Taklimakanibacter lacteus TaxID=2268456 RepID=UPI000E660A31
MTPANPPLPPGYSPLPPGHVANVATFLEMKSRPGMLPQIQADDLSIRQWQDPDPAAYRALFRTVGEAWLWQSRLFMADERLQGIFRNPDVEIYRLFRAEAVAGLLELDFTSPGECELSFFGLVPQEIGKGAGRFLMTQAIRRAWARPIKRFWVHTCTFDHPAAIGFYRRSGFTPYDVQVEVHPDPRLTGHMPREAAPHVAIIEK